MPQLWQARMSPARLSAPSSTVKKLLAFGRRQGRGAWAGWARIVGEAKERFRLSDPQVATSSPCHVQSFIDQRCDLLCRSCWAIHSAGIRGGKYVFAVVDEFTLSPSTENHRLQTRLRNCLNKSSCKRSDLRVLVVRWHLTAHAVDAVVHTSTCITGSHPYRHYL